MQTLRYVQFFVSVLFVWLMCTSANALDCSKSQFGEFNNRPVVLKSIHGYLSDRVDSNNVARVAESVAGWEQLLVSTYCGEDLKWGSIVSIKSRERGGFLSGQNGEADFRYDSDNHHFWIMQNANDVSAQGNMNCGDKVAFKNYVTGEYLVSEAEGEIKSNRRKVGEWERWEFICKGNPLYNPHLNTWIGSSAVEVTSRVKCNGQKIGLYNNRPTVLKSEFGFISNRISQINNARTAPRPAGWERVRVQTVCGENLSWGSVVKIESLITGRYLSGYSGDGYFRDDTGEYQYWVIQKPDGPSVGQGFHCNEEVNFQNLVTGEFLVSLPNGDVKSNRKSAKNWERWKFVCIGKPDGFGNLSSVPRDFPQVIIAGLKTEDAQPYKKNGKPAKWIRDASKGWLGRLPDSRRLNELSVPGTHDSGALYGGDAFAVQTWSINEQLNSGIRYFDIRLRHYADKFLVYHGGVYQRQTFDDVLKEMRTFLSENRNEFVFMQVREEYRPELNNRSFADTWKKYMNGSPGDRPNWKWKEMFARGVDKNTDLGSVRGKVVVIGQSGRIPEGYGILDTSNDLIWQNRYKVYAGDYNFHSSEKATLGEKRRLVEKYISKADTTGSIVVNFLSGSVGLMPWTVAESTNKFANDMLKSLVGRKKTGVLVMDYPGEQLIYHIIRSNFVY